MTSQAVYGDVVEMTPIHFWMGNSGAFHVGLYLEGRPFDPTADPAGTWVARADLVPQTGGEPVLTLHSAPSEGQGSFRFEPGRLVGEVTAAVMAAPVVPGRYGIEIELVDPEDGEPFVLAVGVVIVHEEGTQSA